MRAVVQRVTSAVVRVDQTTVGRIGTGLLVLLGVGAEDRHADADYLSEKVIHLRIFEDEQGKMNRSVNDVGGELLVVSQFTLYGDCRRGRRPSYSSAAAPEKATQLYEYFVAKLKECGVPVETGVFRAMMDVELVNSGPVTILLDSKKGF